MGSVVGIDDVHADALARGERGHDGPQRGGGAPAPPDHAAQVFRVHTHLEDLAPGTPATGIDAHPIGVVDDPANEVLERVSQRLLCQEN